MSEVHGYTCVDGELPMLSQLSSLIAGERLPQRRRQSDDGLGDGHAGGLCGASLWQRNQHGEARRSFHKCPQRGVGPLADHEITFPVTGNLAVGDLGGAFVDAHHVDDPMASVVAAALQATMLLALPQASQQGTLQFAFGRR